ncbi:hypothetical protein Taro_011710 [Colocasia esculenta]|uniref:Choline transporter-like protein n=1 Tax=Colocasia esculenta TaxID=4460 RepID=A0A843UDE7_COLES|nr:hypothetical protein [Colocasia esculenta]
MGAAPDAVVGEAGGDGGEKEQKGGDGEEKVEELHSEEESKQQEGKGKGKGGKEEVVVVVDSVAREDRVSRLQTQHPVAPIQVAPHGDAVQSLQTRSFQPTPPLHATPSQMATPPGGVSTSLNSRRYTNRISLFVFLFHLVVAGALICFFCYKAVEGLLASDGPRRRKERHVLAFWLPPVEGSSVLAIALAFAWQKAVRAFPTHFTVRFIIWFGFASPMSAGILLLCFSMPATDGAGVALILFAVGSGLYACWVTRRTAFAAKVLARSLHPAETKFRTLNFPAYLMMLAGFVWISLWCFAVIGAHNFYYPPLTVLALVLSLMWTAEVMRNVANLTVSRVVALYYLRGMQSDVGFCFQRALTRSLGSACLGSLFVPAIEASRIIARGLNLLEGEDEFMFSCAHCCLHVVEAIFRNGNSWAFVHVCTNPISISSSVSSSSTVS